MLIWGLQKYHFTGASSGFKLSTTGIPQSSRWANRIHEFWLAGPKAFLQLPGRPEKIKRNSKNEFWVAMS
ncbi:hypothetical protein VNO78_02717 [Psophocarpus tetragonolobus]|uniref:Uncharacterized protein n=1 Tax=Psophocarpus tetragonolobus TaxID=3891 RepID=A0AAN9XW95_PSOTE